MGRRKLLATSDLVNIARGSLMGGADIIPGVSGGTVALILGIYERLVTAISHFDVQLIRLVKEKKWTAAADHIHFRFLATLGCGIGMGVVLLASLMHYLLAEQLQYTLSVFLGLMLASSWLVFQMIDGWSKRAAVLLIAGVIFAYCLVGLSLFENPPGGNLYVFFCGTVAICAMILPGISGAYILLLMGKYTDILGLLKGLLHGDITVAAVTTVGIFLAGCLIGLISFSKFLRWLLSRYEQSTMALLCGFMIGSLRKIWPYKLDLTPGVEKFKLKQFENIWPDNFGTAEWTSIGLIVAASVFVLVLDRLTAGHEHVPPLKSETD